MTTLNYTLVITAAPDAGRSHARALAFATAVLARGHHVVRVFFYQGGVRIALPWDGDEISQWQDINATNNTELILCSASAELYGVQQPPAGFDIAGLGSLMEAGHDSDRVLTFA